MRLRIILLWGLFVSCVQLRAQDWQEISAKFNSQPVITISDERVSIKFDYSFSANDENVIFRYEIFDSNGKKVSDKNFDINGMSYHNPLIFERQKFARYTPPFYVDASIRWQYSEGEYFELAATDKIPFAFNATSSYSIPSSSTNSFAPPSSSSYSSNTNSKYKALSDPNLVDNSEEISRCEKVIEELENQKLHCSYCNGTHKIPTNCNRCSGTGTIKMGYYTPQFFKCNYCGGTGRTYKPCIECQKTDVSISISRNMLKTYKETHGMTKETAAFYHEHNSKMGQMDRDYQNSINAIAEPYLNSTRKSNSSHSSTSSSPKCSMCNGTGIDPHAYHSGDPKPAVGGYTHSSGGKCIYCGKYEWHQHVYCPKCNANKYP